MSACRSCGAPVIWAITDSGKAMPVDEKPVLGGSLELNWDGGEVRVKVITPTPERLGNRPHFITCPDADGWRKR